MSYSAQDKFNIVQYSLKHGIETTLEALSLDSNRKLSRITLIRWRNKWKTSCEQNYGAGNKFDLRDKSKKPKNYRKSEVDGRILLFIQQTRLQYPNLGKDKLKVLVDNYCNKQNLRDSIKLRDNTGSGLKDSFTPITTISTSTIGRIISSFKKQRIIPVYKYSKQVYLDGRSGQIKQRLFKPKQKPKTRRKDYQPNSPGELIQLDAVTFYLNGIKRYLVCAVDLVSRYSFVYAYKSLSSNSTKDFFLKMQNIFPYQIKKVQTDNGQENHKNFDQLLKEKDITHFWNYPKSPKMNAYIERFNRSIQEEFANYNLWLLRDDLQGFNLKLMLYLDFYNHQRPHLGLKRDVGQFIAPMQYLKQYHPRYHM
jgi:putative transposase